MKRDPRFPDRPDHRDFDLLSEVLVEQDKAMDEGTETFMDSVNRRIDLDSLDYAAFQQAGMMLQADGKGKMIYSANEVRHKLQACFMAAFVFGVDFEQRRAARQSAD